MDAAAATGMSRGWWVGMGDCTLRGAGGGGWLPRSVDRSVVACSAVSCLDRACSYSRLQCDKRRMRPSPSLSLSASLARRGRLTGERDPSCCCCRPSREFRRFPLLRWRRIRCYRLRITTTANDATPTRPSVSPYTRREHSPTHLLATRKRSEARLFACSERGAVFDSDSGPAHARPWAHMQNILLCALH